MKISFFNYDRINKEVYNDLIKWLDKGISLKNDTEMWHYQSWLEKEIGLGLGNKGILGAKSGTIERALGKISKRKYVIGVSSGTAAMQFSLLALGIGEGDEVITQPNTYVGTALAISNTGAKPKFADINPDTMLIDLNKLEEKITEKTKAILPVHLYGQMIDMKEISKIARSNNLHLVEDAAHSMLASFDGIIPGDLSEAACYSLHPNKNLGAATNGGIVITKERKIFRGIEILRDPRSNNPLLLKSHRTPAYLDWIQMIFVKTKLNHLEKWTSKRREIASIYLNEIKNKKIILPKIDRRAYHVFCEFPIRAKKRDKLKKYLKSKGIETAIHYTTPIHLQEIYKHLKHRKGDFPASEELCSQVLCLPINPFLEDEEVSYIVKSINNF